MSGLTDSGRSLNPKLKAVLARLCDKLGPVFTTQAVKLPYLVDVIASQVLGHSIGGATYEAWEHGVVAREVFRFVEHEAEADEVFHVEPHQYSESGKLISLAADIDLSPVLSPEELAVIDFVADEYGSIAPEQLGHLTKLLNTEMPPEAWGTNAGAAVNQDAFLRLSPSWQELCQRISEEDLDDRRKWSEPIDANPLAHFMRALNG